ncbi:MAG: hypothetical protein IJK89_10210 [Clostridia bacterium]|nr:hypothetical protein [Clostridia bacterium]
MTRSKKTLSVLLALVMLLSLGAPALATEEEPDYDWVTIPTSSEGLNEGEYYLNLSSILLADPGDPQKSRDYYDAACAGAWEADHEYRVVRGSFEVPASISETGEAYTETLEANPWMYETYVMQAARPNWTPLPKSPEGLSEGAYYISVEELFQFISVSDDSVKQVYRGASYAVDLDRFVVQMTAEIGGAPFVVESKQFLMGVRETDIDWIPVHFYTDGLADGDWYMDFEEELAVMMERGIYAPGDTDGPHIRAMYERQGLANSYYVNPGSVLFRYKVENTRTATDENGQEYTYTTERWYPLMEIAFPDPSAVYAARFDRSIRQYHAVNYTWDVIPTSAEGLAPGECYLDFTHIRDNYSDEHRQLAVAMYNEGEWFIDYGKMVLKGSIDIPPELYPHNQPYHMIYDPSTVLLSTCLREADEDWRELPYGPDGLNEGDWYLDTDTFMAIIGRDNTEAERDEVLELLKRHVVFSYNPNGVHLQYRYTYTQLPDENGTPVSGSTTLPLDLELNEDGAYLFDYNALRYSVKQYVAPASEDPETPDPSSGNNGGATDFGARFRAFIASILSFFRKLFNRFSA